MTPALRRRHALPGALLLAAQNSRAQVFAQAAVSRFAALIGRWVRLDGAM